MKTFIEKNDKRIILFLAPALLLMVAGLCVFAITVYHRVSEHTVTNISGVYLREMTTQISSHFQTNLNSQFSQIRTITNAISENDLKDEDSLRHFRLRGTDLSQRKYLGKRHDPAGHQHSSHAVSGQPAGRCNRRAPYF